MSTEFSPIHLPHVRRTKRGFEIASAGRRLCLSADGGELLWIDEAGEVTRCATLQGSLDSPQGEIAFRQSCDSDPRLVVCEQGSVRTVLRAQFDLLSPANLRLGEGLTEWTIYHHGPIVGVVSLRFINPDLDRKLLNAELCITDQAPELGDSIIACREGKSYPYELGQGAWHSLGDDTPYYEDWGPLPSQGWSRTGWSVGPGSGLHQSDGNVTIAFVHSSEGVELSPVTPMQGQLLIVPNCEHAAATVRAWKKPTELVVTGAHYRGYSTFGAAHLVYAPDSTEWEVEIPATNHATTLHVYGLQHWGAWSVQVGDAELFPQLINDGHGCDDPNGLQLGRFDDRHGPIRGETDQPANRMLLTIPPSKEAQVLRAKAIDGLGMSYLHWDDRQTYLIQSSSAQTNTCELSVRDGKLRNIRRSQRDEPAVAAIPLYWYQCNTPTPYMAVDDVQACTIDTIDGNTLSLTVEAENRYGCAIGQYQATLTIDADAFRVDVEASLKVHKTWVFRDLQLLNLFAERYRDHRTWPHEFALAMDKNHQKMLKRPQEGRQVVDGELFERYEPPLLFAQYSASRGNIFLGHRQVTGPVHAEHVLCPHWLDSHFHVVSDSGELKPGDQVTGSYTLVIDDGRTRTTTEVAEIAAAFIRGEDLVRQRDASPSA